jgi:hypothetical protein
MSTTTSAIISRRWRRPLQKKATKPWQDVDGCSWWMNEWSWMDDHGWCSFSSLGSYIIPFFFLVKSNPKTRPLRTYLPTYLPTYPTSVGVGRYFDLFRKLPDFFDLYKGFIHGEKEKPPPKFTRFRRKKNKNPNHAIFMMVITWA